MTQYHERWEGYPIWAVTDDRTIHAVPDASQDWALCEREGDRRHGDIYLQLQHPDCAAEHRARVNCPGCLEWLHA